MGCICDFESIYYVISRCPKTCCQDTIAFTLFSLKMVKESYFQKIDLFWLNNNNWIEKLNTSQSINANCFEIKAKHNPTAK